VFKIEKNVPAPIKRHPSTIYPYGEMEVGDSFFAPEEMKTRLRTAATVFKRKTGRNFTIRQVEGGIRVWRVA